MSDPESARNDADSPQELKNNADPTKTAGGGPGKSDVLALGIGCLVFCIFFVAIVVVSIMRE